MNVEKLADAAVQIAVVGALKYLKAHNLRATDEVLAACVNSHVKAGMKAALHDVKEAFDCGMHHAGMVTFQASMINAGIEAAKEAGMPEAILAAERGTV